MTLELQHLIHKKVSEIYSEIVQIRRELHKKPEIGFDTENTEKYIKNILIEEDIEVLESTIGVMGKIEGRNKERFVALRADIDALPLKELSEVEYKSVHENKMHGCGHDGHTAMLIGAAKILNSIKEALPYSVLLIFQPAEEGPNLGGARIFVKDFKESGLIDKIERIHALHLTNDYRVGELVIGKGAVAASTDEFSIKVIGEAGHAAEPHKSKNALSIAIKIVSEMERFMDQEMNSHSRSIFSVGKLNSGTARNIVPGECEFEGTIRCQDEKDRIIIKDHLKEFTQCMCERYGVKSEIDIIDGLMPLVVDEEVSRLTYEVAKEYVSNTCRFSDEQRMYAEDFAYFAEVLPSSYVWLGSGNRQKGLVEKLHSPKFDFDEEALAIGTLLLCSLVALAE